jgi:hypothetical protein
VCVCVWKGECVCVVCVCVWKGECVYVICAVSVCVCVCIQQLMFAFLELVVCNYLCITLYLCACIKALAFIPIPFLHAHFSLFFAVIWENVAIPKSQVTMRNYITNVGLIIGKEMMKMIVYYIRILLLLLCCHCYCKNYFHRHDIIAGCSLCISVCFISIPTRIRILTPIPILTFSPIHIC